MLTESRNRSPGMAENYFKYKLDYPRKLIDFLYNECDFSWESVIADIGSGTGTFTRLLLERGSRVVAIEPDRELRETTERILEDEFPRFFPLKLPQRTPRCPTGQYTILYAPSLFISLMLKGVERNSGVFFDPVVQWP